MEYLGWYFIICMLTIRLSGDSEQVDFRCESLCCFHDLGSDTVLKVKLLIRIQS